jgi:hypothetical protein
MNQFDVLCIGNAIVDIIARCDEAFLVDNAIIKGAMNLIDAERAELLYSRMGPPSRPRAAAPATPPPASPVSAAGRPISARWPMTSSARSSTMTSGRKECISRPGR